MTSVQQYETSWEGPFKGVLKLIPYDPILGKPKQINCKSLEEAKQKAENFNGKIGGITKTKEGRYSLRLGDRIFPSIKGEESWIYVNPNRKNNVSLCSPLDIPENEEEWTSEDERKFEEWEEKEDKRWYMSKMIRKEFTDKFLPWTYDGRMYLLNSITNEVRDKNTREKIGHRVLYRAVKKDDKDFEVLIWSKVPKLS